MSGVPEQEAHGLCPGPLFGGRDNGAADVQILVSLTAIQINVHAGWGASN
jgi:hypothetical protein